MAFPTSCVSTYQDPSKQVSVVLRTSLPAPLLEPQIRHEIQSIDPGLPVFNVVSMNDILDRSLASRRFSADLVGGFAGLAVLLASIRNLWLAGLHGQPKIARDRYSHGLGGRARRRPEAVLAKGV